MAKQIRPTQALLLLSLMIFISSCAHSGLMNDFFGIQMNPADQDYFKIVSYSEAKGANFVSTPDMNPRVIAWANFQEGTVRINVINHTSEPIPTRWEDDYFTVTLTDGREIVLDKGLRANYPPFSEIGPQSRQTYVLTFPKVYWNTFGQGSGSGYILDFWRGNKSTYLHKNEIEKIYIYLNGGTELILKPVPKKRNADAQ